MDASELLERLSGTLRNEIAPAVDDEFTTTQAYMASVILAKLAKQVALAPEHAKAEEADIATLREQLGPILQGAPSPVGEALDRASSIAGFGAVIESLYHWGIDQPAAAQALSIIRVALRKDIDRRMEIAS